MKKLILISFLFSLPALAQKVICEDLYGREFPGTIEIEMNGRFASKILYAENKKDFVKIIFERLTLDQHYRGGSKYSVSIPMVEGVFSGILKMSIGGDVLLESLENSFYLSCETNE